MKDKREDDIQDKREDEIEDKRVVRYQGRERGKISRRRGR